jgi:hypothetical protein
MNPTTPAPDKAPLPLLGVDKGLGPLRRVVGWVKANPAGRQGQVRFLEHNGGAGVKPLLTLDLPSPVLELITELLEQLDGLDQADDVVRCDRFSVLAATLDQLDRLLGLPLDVQPMRARRAVRPKKYEG